MAPQYQAVALLLFSGIFAMIGSTIARHGYKGVEGQVALQQKSSIALLLGALILPCFAALTIWSFLALEWWQATLGLICFITIVPLAIGLVIAPFMRHPWVLAVRTLDPIISLLAIASAASLWLLHPPQFPKFF